MKDEHHVNILLEVFDNSLKRDYSLELVERTPAMFRYKKIDSSSSGEIYFNMGVESFSVDYADGSSVQSAEGEDVRSFLGRVLNGTN
jgi:hypothetical protein